MVKMLFILSFKFIFLGYSIASALILNLTSPTSSQKALNTTTASILSNYTRLGNKVSDLTFEGDCNGVESAVDLTKENCQDVVEHGIPDVTNRAIINYGDRSVGWFDVNLPQRYISGDGRCIVDVILDDIHKRTSYYPFGIALAATFVQAKCVIGHSPAQGGTLEGFEESHNMKVVLKTYQPNVVCVGQTISPDIQESCQTLLDTMETDETAIAFGVTRDSLVHTPYSRVSADGLCVMEINTSGIRSDVASWRDFWEVGVALNGVCIRNGREGFQINIGAAGGLHMELKDDRNLEEAVSSF